MDVTVTIGPDTDERSVSLTITDENGFNPDVFEYVREPCRHPRLLALA